jgi:hypothetical protein
LSDAFSKLGLDGLGRRLGFFFALTWVPLVALSGFSNSEELIALLMNFGVHSRFFIALPLFLIAEPLLEHQLNKTVGRFVSDGLVREELLAPFRSAIAETEKARDGWAVELCALVFAVSHNPFLHLEGASFLAGTPAGWWRALVSEPVLNFLLFRWGWRSILWTSLLWRISRLKLELAPIHPDRAGGLGFLSASHEHFVILCFAVGVIVATSLKGPSVSIKGIMTSFISIQIAVTLCPLLVFLPMLVEMKFKAQRDYGALAMRYARDFHSKWILEKTSDELLGNSDIQTLSDLDASMGIIAELKMTPVSKRTAIAIATASALPFLPDLARQLPFLDALKAIFLMPI